MAVDNKAIIEDLKDLNDLEFEVVFIDSIQKKLKQLVELDAKSPSLLLAYLSVVESLKKFKELCTEGNRKVLHEDIIDLLISKGDSFLSKVAFDEDKYMYVSKSLNSMNDVVKDLMLSLKNDLTDLPQYAHLKVH